MGESRRGEVRRGKQLTKEAFVYRGFCMALAFFYGWGMEVEVVAGLNSSC